ncbi:tripartite tricarboxylate transporter substrate binding protein [Pigmentiphaga sp. H8]|uniref:Bug family tripartite tricarboxylate transporter substrate binding protein n=1 Tax=Pigmentiphaga sp. H8 TaxID=2488560 RepID=UPI000F5B2110|nr:tripartite tricarboxylate transporter substrate binding protein [Pigmentiphaga sp. H8]AZG06728.1 tripartite tricarboxylate transporter substrate binding protein [Pigmentiphaga sp. H8]
MIRLTPPACLLALAVTTAAAPCATAQPAYPGGPVRMLSGSPPGAPSDIIARSLAEQLAASFGQTFTVENRPGAGLNLAPGEMLRARPDGHVLLVGADTVVTVNPLVYKKLSFDARRDMVPVSMVATFNQVLVCHPGVKVDRASQLVELAGKKRLTYASGGNGTPGHLAGAMFLRATGADIQHVAYRGPGPALTDVLGGQVDCGWLAGPTVLPHIKTGRLTALAVSTAIRSPSLPEVPTLAQATGVDGLDATFKQYVWVHKDTPPASIAVLQEAVARAMKHPAIIARLTELDMVTAGTPSAEAAAMLKADTARWEPIVRSLDLQLD